MKFNIKWFAITMMIIGTIPMMILFIWCGVNGFGSELVTLFESIHPSGGFSIIQNVNGTIASKIVGTIINTLYCAVDFFIVGFAFSSLYNFFIAMFEK